MATSKNITFCRGTTVRVVELVIIFIQWWSFLQYFLSRLGIAHVVWLQGIYRALLPWNRLE